MLAKNAIVLHAFHARGLRLRHSFVVNYPVL